MCATTFRHITRDIQDCLDRLDRKQAEDALRDLIAQLKAAEREGRTDDAQVLNARVNELRLQKAGRPAAALSSARIMYEGS